MKTFNNEIVIHRNESFTMDKLIENKDGSPYIISSELLNESDAYFLLTVSSSRYVQNGRYISNYWLSLSDYPLFKNTNPINLADYGESSFPTTLEDGKLILTYNQVTYESSVYDDVFYIIDEYGTYTYAYFTYDENADDVAIWHTYQCRFTKQFSTNETAELVEQSYLYSLSIVSGQSTLSYLQELCIANDIDYLLTDDVQILYNLLINAGITVNIDLQKPLATFDCVLTILPPTKLSVLSSLNGNFIQQ